MHMYTPWVGWKQLISISPPPDPLSFPFSEWGAPIPEHRGRCSVAAASRGTSLPFSFCMYGACDNN